MALAALSFALACRNATFETSAIDRVTITPASLALSVGDSAQLTASVTVSRGSPGTTVTWRADNPSVAAVTAAGVVIGVSAGMATVRAIASADPSREAVATVTVAPPDLRRVAARFAVMPKDRAALVRLRPSASTFASGTPFDDLEYTVFETDYMEGETGGFDTFMPVAPSQAAPGADQVRLVAATGHVDRDAAQEGERGDRIILGTAEHPAPFFLRGANGLDDDYAVIVNFNYVAGHIQLRGAPRDYALIRCTVAEGCRTTGFYLFYTAGGEPDLIAFIFPCDDLMPAVNGAVARDPKVLCNAGETLSLADPVQFRFATPVAGAPVALGTQFGATGKEVVASTTTDAAGNRYVLGLTDGGIDGGSVPCVMFVVKLSPAGTREWLTEIPMQRGSLLFDATTDGAFLYAVGRTLGALPGQASAGGWDAIILKMRLTDGTVVASRQFGNQGLDGLGNVALDDAGHLYVSGAGSPPSATGQDNSYLVAKFRTADLGQVWTQIVPPLTDGFAGVSEAWGGLTYVPGPSPGAGRLVVGGWTGSTAGGGLSPNGFVEVWSDLALAAPRRIASAIIGSPGAQADWVLDNAVDAQGNVYAVGYTTGRLGATAGGKGDAFIVRFDANLRNPVYRQVGTVRGDGFRKLDIAQDGTLFATGYSYGAFAGANADPTGGSADIIIQRFDEQLRPLGALQFGSAREERGYTHLRGNILHIGGMTEGAVAGPHRGSFDGFSLRVDAQTLRIIP